MAWKASHYTHLIPLSSGDGVVYNGRSGALVKLSPGAFARCEAILSSSAGSRLALQSREMICLRISSPAVLWLKKISTSSRSLKINTTANGVDHSFC